MKTEHSEWNGAEWLKRCAWCAQEIVEDHEVFGISMKFRPGQARPEWAGKVQPLQLVVSARTVPMMVCGADSPAKRDGKDALFQVCSDACGKELQKALQREIDMGDIIAEQKPRG
jgi:hypothetical protein